MEPADLRAWRDRMGYTQIQAARAMGISYWAYKAVETGRRPIKAHHVKLVTAIEAGLLNLEDS